jgi:hypothetical protein
MIVKKYLGVVRDEAVVLMILSAFEVSMPTYSIRNKIKILFNIEEKKEHTSIKHKFVNSVDLVLVSFSIVDCCLISDFDNVGSI